MQIKQIAGCCIIVVFSSVAQNIKEINKIKRIIGENILLPASKIINNGPHEEDHIRASHERPLFPGGADAMS